jgi:methylglutaconyl-CoA hydratase
VSGQTLIVAEDGPVLRLTLDRPERRNAFDAALLAALTVAVEQAPERVGVRCVVLAGRGEAFCAGADVDWMRRSADLSEADNVADAERAAALFAAVASCPLPVVARVHGAALGGGAGLVCAADLAVAADDATIGFPEVRLGLVAATVAPHVVRRIGAGAARAMFLTGRAVDAREALRLGLVHRVAPAADLDAAVAATVEDLLRAGPAVAPADVAAVTARRIAAVRRGTEAQAGLRAFLAGERPPWR